MDKKIQSRFFTIMSCYLDDDRIASHCICEFSSIESSPEIVYKDLLSAHYDKYIDYLENIAEKMTWKQLQEWCKQKQFELDMMRSPFWSRGDDKMIEMEAWKI